MKKKRAVSLHTEFTSLYLCCWCPSCCFWPRFCRARSPQQVDILPDEVVEFQGGSDRTTLQIPVHRIIQLLVWGRLEDECREVLEGQVKEQTCITVKTEGNVYPFLHQTSQLMYEAAALTFYPHCS